MPGDGDGAGLFAHENVVGETRTDEDRAQDVERRLALVGSRERAQADRGAIHVDACRQQRAEIGQTVRDRRFVHVAGAEVEHRLRQ